MGLSIGLPAPLTPQTTTPTDRQSYGSPMECLGHVQDTRGLNVLVSRHVVWRPTAGTDQNTRL